MDITNKHHSAYYSSYYADDGFGPVRRENNGTLQKKFVKEWEQRKNELMKQNVPSDDITEKYRTIKGNEVVYDGLQSDIELMQLSMQYTNDLPRNVKPPARKLRSVTFDEQQQVEHKQQKKTTSPNMFSKAKRPSIKSFMNIFSFNGNDNDNTENAGDEKPKVPRKNSVSAEKAKKKASRETSSTSATAADKKKKSRRKSSIFGGKNKEIEQPEEPKKVSTTDDYSVTADILDFTLSPPLQQTVLDQSPKKKPIKEPKEVRVSPKLSKAEEMRLYEKAKHRPRKISSASKNSATKNSSRYRHKDAEGNDQHRPRQSEDSTSARRPRKTLDTPAISPISQRHQTPPVTTKEQEDPAVKVPARGRTPRRKVLGGDFNSDNEDDREMQPKMAEYRRSEGRRKTILVVQDSAVSPSFQRDAGDDVASDTQSLSSPVMQKHYQQQYHQQQHNEMSGKVKQKSRKRSFLSRMFKLR